MIVNSYSGQEACVILKIIARRGRQTDRHIFRQNEWEISYSSIIVYSSIIYPWAGIINILIREKYDKVVVKNSFPSIVHVSVQLEKL